MRRLSPLVALVGAFAFASSAAASTLFVVDGRGWGHGVGLSQWGAQGKALRDISGGYKAILDFYYPGTTLKDVGSRKVRVLLTRGRSSVAVSSDADFTIGTRTLRAHTVYYLVVSANGQVRIAGLGKFGDPATLRPTSAHLRLGGAPYRGNFRVFVHSGKLDVVNVVRLQGYLYGVVPREMPSWFEQEALKAQAVAARSYGLRVHRASWFDLYPDTRDQVYGGACAGCETANSAVKATAGEVLYYGSQIAQTFFSSSNGGYKADSGDVWITSLPYLRAGPDPDDLTPQNPNRYWKHVLTRFQMAHRVGIRRPSDVSVSRNGSSRAETVTFATPGGARSFAGSTIMGRLGLKGMRYWIGIQSLRASRARSHCKERVAFTIFSHGLRGIALQKRSVKETGWTKLTLSGSSPNWTASHRPCVSMDYRLHSAKANNPVLRLPVSPAIAFDSLQQAGALTGKVNPLLPGQTVTVQKKTSSGWRVVATTTIKSDGSFKARFTVRNGVYRAKVVPPASTGLVTGFSPRLTVVVSG